jgi:hypothetical protein
MVTLAGLVFSALTAAMSLSVTALSVRISPVFQADHVIQWGLGCFVGRYAYALLIALSSAVDGDAYRPWASTVVAVAITVGCGVMLIAVAVRVCRLLNPGALLRHLTAEGRDSTRYASTFAPRSSPPAPPPAAAPCAGAAPRGGRRARRQHPAPARLRGRVGHAHRARAQPGHPRAERRDPLPHLGAGGPGPVPRARIGAGVRRRALARQPALRRRALARQPAPRCDPRHGRHRVQGALARCQRSQPRRPGARRDRGRPRRTRPGRRPPPGGRRGPGARPPPPRWAGLR